MSRHNVMIQKIVWSLAPLGWGAFSWLVWNTEYVAREPYPFLLLALGGSIFTIVFLRKMLDRALTNTLYFFHYPIPLPTWRMLLALMPVGILLCITPLFQFDLVHSLVGGILISAIFEEFVAHSFFATYRMGILEFLFFNTLSAISFNFMHCFYGEGIIASLSAGHLGFGFALGFLVYKTQRIELAILLHMLSNLARYTVPVVMFGTPWPSLLAVLDNIVFELLFYSCLAGCTYVALREQKNGLH